MWTIPRRQCDRVSACFLSSTDLLDLNCKQAQTVGRPFYLTTDCQTPQGKSLRRPELRKLVRVTEWHSPDLTNKQPLKWHLTQPQTTRNTLDPSNKHFRPVHVQFSHFKTKGLRNKRLDYTLLMFRPYHLDLVQQFVVFPQLVQSQ